MNRDDNIFYAKRNIIDSIWKEANIEGVAVTFPQTQEIFEGRTVAGLSFKDTVIINNLKHAWQFLLETIDYPLDLQWISQLHYEIGQYNIVSYPGERRDSTVTIGGTDWIPKIPTYDGFNEDVMKAMSIADPTDRALTLFCVIARTQYFNDGNKRTAQLAANKVLIENGCGILAIPQKYKEEFADHLVAYYESGDSLDLKAFLKEKAVDNPDIQPPKERFVPNREKFLNKTPSLKEVAKEIHEDLNDQKRKGITSRIEINEER